VKYEFTAQARVDFLSAIEWYHEQSPAAAQKFKLRVDLVLGRIVAFPESGALQPDGVRCVLVSGFPYLIYYFPDATPIAIVAVFHTSRAPDSWRERESPSE